MNHFESYAEFLTQMESCSYSDSFNIEESHSEVPRVRLTRIPVPENIPPVAFSGLSHIGINCGSAPGTASGASASGTTLGGYYGNFIGTTKKNVPKQKKQHQEQHNHQHLTTSSSEGEQSPTLDRNLEVDMQMSKLRLDGSRHEAHYVHSNPENSQLGTASYSDRTQRHTSQPEFAHSFFDQDLIHNTYNQDLVDSGFDQADFFTRAVDLDLNLDLQNRLHDSDIDDEYDELDESYPNRLLEDNPVVPGLFPQMCIDNTQQFMSLDVLPLNPSYVSR